MEFDIQQKPLTTEQTQFVAEEFAKLDMEIFHARNTIKQYTFVIENPDYIGSLKARLSWGNFHIVELFVRKEMRHKGIGTNLIRHAVSVGHGRIRQNSSVSRRVILRQNASMRNLDFNFIMQCKAMHQDLFFGL